MSIKSRIKDVQKALGVTVDGKAGEETWEAIHKRIVPEDAQAEPQNPDKIVEGKASSFADPADVKAFRKCKAQGKSDQQCFRVGDNGIGCYEDDTTDASIPYVAIRPDDMIEIWGGVVEAKHQPVLVTIGEQEHRCIVGDRMPWAKNVKNGAVIDLAPGAQKLFGLTPPFMVNCSWNKA